LAVQCLHGAALSDSGAPISLNVLDGGIVRLGPPTSLRGRAIDRINKRYRQDCVTSSSSSISIDPDYRRA